jgi:hypothetical protein
MSDGASNVLITVILLSMIGGCYGCTREHEKTKRNFADRGYEQQMDQKGGVLWKKK